jgi:hypothetical protein
MDKKITVKFTGGREGEFLSLSLLLPPLFTFRLLGLEFCAGDVDGRLESELERRGIGV